MTTATAAGQSERDTTALSSIPARMIEAWNRADAAGFAAPFTDTADFIGYDGTHLTGRDQITAYHQYLLDTDMKGTRLAGEVRFVRLVTADAAIIHTYESTIPTGADAPAEARNSMQLLLARRVGDAWQIETLQSSRRLAPARQELLDGIDALPPDSRRRLTELVISGGTPA